MTKAILIDPYSQTTKPVALPAAPEARLSEIYKLLGCDCIDAARLGDGHAVYVDDEGLFREGQHFFLVDDYPQPLAGRGLFVGPVNEEGDTTDIQRDPVVRFIGDRTDLRVWLTITHFQEEARLGDD